MSVSFSQCREKKDFIENHVISVPLKSPNATIEHQEKCTTQSIKVMTIYNLLHNLCVIAHP